MFHWTRATSFRNCRKTKTVIQVLFLTRTFHTSSCNRNIYFLFAPVLEVTNGAPFIIFLVYNIQHFLFQSQSEIRDLNNNLSSHHSDHFGGMGGIIKMFYINFHVCYDTRILNLDTIIVLKQL